MPSTITADDLMDAVYHEVELLDEGQFDAWLSLYTDDAHYWMPLTPGQTDAKLQCSLMYEDILLLKIRIERLRGERTFSQQPRSRCHHLLQRPRVLAMNHELGHYRTKTAFHYTETRLDQQTLFAGWASHDWVLSDGQLKIQLKRVDLVNCDAAFGNINLFM